MWLRDAIPHDLPGARVLTYGYDTQLAGSNSFQNLEDVARTFRASLRVALGSRPPDRPLIFIAHSLGGLVLKQALIQMASEDSIDRRILQSTFGILFFGVPNQGMDISSLLAMVGSQPNLPFLTMLSRDSGILPGLVEKFRTVFDFKDSEIVSLYETCASRTAMKDTNGDWSMSGDYAVLVDRYSARSGRSWEESSSLPISRNHSDMVKFSEYDDVGDIVGDLLIRFAKAAPAVIEERLKSLEESTTSSGSRIREIEDDLKCFADAGFNIELGSSRGVGLTWAARKGQVSLVEQLLNRHAPLEQKDEEGWTLLHWAAFTANLELFNLLLSRGADCGARTYGGDSMLHIVSSFGMDHIRRETDDFFGSSSDRKAIGLELLDKGLPIHSKNREQATPLLNAAAWGLESMVVVLASRKARLTFRDRDFRTPLMLAANNGHIGVVRLLIERQNDLTWAEDFLYAAFIGEESAVRTFLEAGVMVDTTDTDWYGKTALMSAAGRGHENIVRLLLDEGADTEAKDKHRGGTAIMWAALPRPRLNEESELRTIRLLLDRGANLRAVDRYGSSALHYAVESNNLGIVNLLLREGADRLALNSGVKSPLDLAFMYGYEEVAERLKKEYPPGYT